MAWTKVTKASGTSWTKITKASLPVTTVGGSPIGLLLALTQVGVTSSGTNWTKITKAT